MAVETQFDEPGTLSRPGIMGRIVRFLMGVLVLSAFYQEADVAFAFITGTRYMDAFPPQSPFFWISVLITFWVFPYVINIGWTKAWGRWPQLVIGLLAGIAILWGIGQFGNWWAPPLEVLLLAWMTYTFGHLGLSFLLASLIATPGCEMRAIPHLWTLLTGRKTKEHYCPGFLDPVDNWESKMGAE